MTIHLSEEIGSHEAAKVLARESSSRFTALVAIACFRCGCTDLEETIEQIPNICPVHEKVLYRSPEWVENTNNVPLGFEECVEVEAREKQMLIDLSSVESESEKKTTSRRVVTQSLDMNDI